MAKKTAKPKIKKGYWMVSIFFGRQAMIKGGTLERARRYAILEWGRSQVEWVREATEIEVDWHESMNGFVNEI